MNIYRPYKSIKKSVSCLSELHLHKVAKIECILLIQMIIEQMGWTPVKYGGNLNDPTFIFYFNKGKPYLKDLIKYQKYATEYWPKKFCGTPHNLLKPFKKIIKKHKEEWRHNDFEWTQDHARWHKLVLLSKDHWWYKRFFRKYFEVNLTKFDTLRIFNKFNKPIKISKRATLR